MSISGVRGAAIGILDQCVGLISELDDAAYAAPSNVLAGGTIGKHVRHSFDHFDAVAVAHGSGDAIDYDHRSRDVPMETDRSAAIDAITSVRDRISRIADADLGKSVLVRVMLSGGGEESEVGSTFGRELFFATHHAIHHHAMIKAIACELGVDACADFGKAPSTINHERSSAS